MSELVPFCFALALSTYPVLPQEKRKQSQKVPKFEKRVKKFYRSQALFTQVLLMKCFFASNKWSKKVDAASFRRKIGISRRI